MLRSVRREPAAGLTAISFGDVWNAFGAVGRGSRGACRVGQGPRVVMAPVITASIAACGPTPLSSAIRQLVEPADDGLRTGAAQVALDAPGGSDLQQLGVDGEADGIAAHGF